MAAAIVELRSTFHETQQRFSDRVGVMLPTIGRWETNGREPSIRYLGQLWVLADQQGRPDLADVFAEAFTLKMGCSVRTGQKLLRLLKSA